MKVLMKSRVPNSLTILLCEQEKDDVPTETIRMKDLDFHIDNIDYGDTTAPYPHQIVIFLGSSKRKRGIFCVRAAFSCKSIDI